LTLKVSPKGEGFNPIIQIITATSRSEGAGIGGGSTAHGGTITINGGTVKAKGSVYAAAVGGGNSLVIPRIINDVANGANVTIGGNGKLEILEGWIGGGKHDVAFPAGIDHGTLTVDGAPYGSYTLGADATGLVLTGTGAAPVIETPKPSWESGNAYLASKQALLGNLANALGMKALSATGTGAVAPLSGVAAGGDTPASQVPAYQA
jgi:hypothetical protein